VRAGMAEQYHFRPLCCRALGTCRTVVTRERQNHAITLLAEDVLAVHSEYRAKNLGLRALDA